VSHKSAWKEEANRAPPSRYCFGCCQLHGLLAQLAEARNFGRTEELAGIGHSVTAVLATE
jgi:hypothetical protein